MEELKKEYKTILGHTEIEIEIKKSRFIANIKRCNTEEESVEFINEIRKIHRDATHNCTSYINGPTKLTQRYDDDGEPQGTAGIPMLEVLKKNDLTDVSVVVTRYFGGIKLGASGLIRAYGDAVVEAIENSDIVWLRNYYKVQLNFDYNFLGKIDNYLQEKEYFLKKRDYLEKVENILYIKVDEFEDFKSTINNITSANIDLEIMDLILLQTREKKIIE